MRSILFYIFTLFVIHSLYPENLDSVILEALKNHPEIKSLRSNFIAKKKDAEHSDVYPDPKFGVAFRNYPYRGYFSLNDKRTGTPGMTGIEYMVSQEIPFPGKLTLQQKARSLSSAGYMHFIRSTENRLSSEMLSNLIRIHSIQKRVKVNKKLIEVNRSIIRIGHSMYISGKQGIGNTLESKIESNRYKDKEISLGIEYKESLRNLEYITNLSEDKLISIPESEVIDWIDKRMNDVWKLKSDELDNLIKENPVYKLTSIEKEVREFEKKAGNLSHYPETEVFLSIMKRRNRELVYNQGPLNWDLMDSNEYQGTLFNFGLTMRVPVWSFFRSHSLSEKLSKDVETMTYEKEKVQRELSIRFKKNLDIYSGLTEEIKFYSSTLIPEIKQAIDSKAAMYKSGNLNSMEILKFQIEYNKAQYDLLELKERRYMIAISILETLDKLL